MSALPVSVVIPCFRAATTLARALASVRAQTRAPLEVLVVDDGSPDGAAIAAVVAQFADLPARLIALPVNVGAGSARNAGWAQARGELIAFLDADDAWHPQKLALQTAVMLADRTLALTAHDVVVARGAPDFRPLAPPAVRAYGWTRTLIINPSATPTWMVARDAPARFREGKRYVEDHLFLLELLAAGGRVLHLEAPLAALFKPALSGAGLSSHLWAMERGELELYRLLRERRAVSGASWAGLSALSLLKFLRRVAVVRLLR